MRSIIGCVETLSQGDVLAFVLFSKVPVGEHVAQLLRGIGHSLRLTLQGSTGPPASADR